MEEAISLVGVEKKIGKTKILKGITFSVKKGEIFGFVGPNGAGKSTTMKVIMNFIKADKGKVFIFGKENTDTSIIKRVGFLPEHPYFYTNVTGFEFLRFIQMILNLEEETFREKVNEYADRLQIKWALNKKLSEYSKGMLQRFGLLQALIGDPDLFLLDEPMSGLDPIGRKLVIDLILELKEKGKTVFFSTHILPDVERLCDRACIIIEGEIRDILNSENLKNIEDIFMEKASLLNLKKVL